MDKDKKKEIRDLARAYVPLVPGKYGAVTQLAKRYTKYLSEVSKVLKGTERVMNKLDYYKIRYDAIVEFGFCKRPTPMN